MSPTAGTDVDAVTQLNGLLRSVHLSSTAQNKFANTEAWLADRLGVQRRDVRATYVSEPKMVAPRLSTPGIVRARPSVVLAAVGQGDLAVYTSAIERKMAADSHLRTVLIAREPQGSSPWTCPVMLTRPGEQVADRIRSLIPSVRSTTVPDPEANRPPGPGRLPRLLDTIVVDASVRRMLRHSIATANATVLIGPPGTGKTTLVEQTLLELAEDPSKYGLQRSPTWGDAVTPDESWTASEVVGGPTVFAGEILFRPGHVLRAIRDDQHLFLDEANRADLDKILGGLLTWLSHKETVVGRLSEAADAPLVTVGWNDHPESRVVNRNLLDDAAARPEDGPGPVRFLAGSEWRLVATYNAVDAQRVFRFGEALGRRFNKVPVPPPGVLAVSELVTDRCTRAGLDDEVAIRLIGCYEAHQGAEETVLGPAPFLDIVPYLVSVTNSGDLALDDEDQAEAALAEGYLTQVGLSLARLEDDELDRLGDRLADARAMGAESWAWLRNLLPALRG